MTFKEISQSDSELFKENQNIRWIVKTNNPKVTVTAKYRKVTVTYSGKSSDNELTKTTVKNNKSQSDSNLFR